ncbi:GNAT family N-acetyltransferase [Methylorubrum populi]|uniref:GNAT family N-acetyltransferase n=1 Tax=Methylobacterium radiotolerans TaxID=31998 RepID=A0ABU7TDI0_9HYPH
MIPFCIRPYASRDLETILNLFQRSIRGIASADYAPAQIEAWSRIDRAVWAEPPAALRRWVAWADGQAAGFADLGPGGHLDKLYVDPAHRRRGVAQALLVTAEAEAIAQGVEGLDTEASLTARPFFEAAGFRVVAQESVIRNGQALRRFRMRKDGLGTMPSPS